MMLASIPAFALAEDTATTTPGAQPPFGGGRRWNQQNLPPAGFVDENQDGVCDTCGQTPGQNPEAPGFTDDNADGVCDHFGTDSQYQGRLQMMQGRMGGMRSPRGGRMQGRGHMAQGRGRSGQVPGMAQGRRFIDENKDGICDLYQNNTNQQPGGRGRFRR